MQTKIYQQKHTKRKINLHINYNQITTTYELLEKLKNVRKLTESE